MQPLFLCLTENLNYALGWMVLHSFWQATLVAFVVGILNILLRKQSAQLRYWVSNVSLLLILGMSIATFCYHYDFTKEPKQVVFVPLNSETQAQVVATIQGINNVANQSPLSIEAFKDYFNHNLPLIVTFWILGVALFMLKLLGGLSYIFYLKKHMNFPTDEYWKDMMEKLSNRAGNSKSIELVESALVKTPLVVGYFKPMILFPMGIINRLSPEEVEAILAHELAHIMRHDYLFNILQSVVEALFYYHPAVWWLSNQIRNERESACDEIAIDLINDKLNYAKALVTIQEMAYYPLLPALGFVTQDVMTQNAFTGQRKNQFLLRMQRILNVPQNKSNIMEKLIATFLIVFALVGLTIAQNKKESKSSDKKQTPQSEGLTGQYSEQNKDKTSETTAIYETFTNITTIGDTIGNPFYTTLPPTPEILKLQSELAQMEKEYPQFVKEKEAYIEKLKAELAEMEGGIASFEKQKEVEIAQVEKEVAQMTGNLPKAEKGTNANIAAILENIKKKEAELEAFIRTVDGENSKIEAQIAEKKKESEGKTTVKRSRVDGEIQGLYGQIQGNLGEIQGRRGEIQGMYGEIQGLKGEMMGNKGEIQGRQGEIMGKRGEIMGRRGEIQGKRGEIQGVRGEMMGKMGEIQGKRGEIQGKYSELVLKSLIADLKSDKVITDDRRLHLRLNQKSMIVNDVKLSDELYAKYKAKYLKDNNRGFEIYKRNGSLNFSMDDDKN